MANSTVGTAYLEIVPKLSKSGLPSSVPGGAAAGKCYGEDVGKGASGALSAKAVAIGNILSNVAMQAGQAFGQLFKDTLENYANYEQLVGGVDTLFKDASATVQANAAAAFQTAGMSANEYMENVTSFSASLLQGLGGDTAKAASYADMAIRDMSDNANKMGTDIGRITDAYQGFAKQNYTMLDNLKLGYGGTKTEMQRLLSDAEKISGQKFDLSNYHDVVEAIHVVQDEMGISGYGVDELREKLSSMSLTADEVKKVAEDMGISYEDAMKRMKDGTLTVEDANVLLGTTAKEAASTIEGSVNSMKAAWTNFTVGLMSGNGDMSVLFGQLADSIGTVAANVLPRIGTMLATVFTELPTYIGNALSKLPEMVRGYLSEAVGPGVADYVSGGLQTVVDGFARIGEAAQQMGQSLADAGVLEAARQLWDGLAPVFNALVDVIVNDLIPAWTKVYEAVGPIVARIISVVETILPPILGLVGSIVGFIGSAIQFIVTLLKPVIDLVLSIVEVVIPPLAAALQAVFDFLSERLGASASAVQLFYDQMAGVVSTIVNTVMGAKDTVVNIFNTLKSRISSIINGIKTTVSNVFNGIKNAITKPIEAAKNTIKGIIDKIKGVFSGLKLELPHFKLPHFTVDGGTPPWGIAGQGKMPTFGIEWYGTGGFTDGATVLNVAGERGTEFVWPSYNPYLAKYAQALASYMPGGTNVYINGTRINDDPAIEGAFWKFMSELQRRHELNGRAIA